jgi:acyl carrier protein
MTDPRQGEVIPQVRRFIEDNFLMGGGQLVGDEDSLMRSHVLDSTGFLELVGFLEKAFDIRVHDLEMVPENLDSLRAIDAYVRQKRSETAPAAGG